MSPIGGKDFGSNIGPDRLAAVTASGSISGYAMASLNTGWTARFTALDTSDIYSVMLRWISVTTPGTVQLRIETIDTTSGKPSGTLYDANAVFDITPEVGVQTYTFVTPPSTGLTVGSEYAVVLLTTSAGTTQTLASHQGTTPTLPSRLPCTVLTASDGTTRNNFVEVGGAAPIVQLIDSTGRYITNGFSHYYVITPQWLFGNSSSPGNTVLANRVVISAPVSIAGIALEHLAKQGNPGGSIRGRIWDQDSVFISGTATSTHLNSMSSTSVNRGGWLLFPAPVILSGGSYYVGIDSLESVASGNSWTINSVTAFSDLSIPENYTFAISRNDGSTWVSYSNVVNPITLIVDEFIPAVGSISSAGGSNFYPVGTGLFRGMI